MEAEISKRGCRLVYGVIQKSSLLAKAFDISGCHSNRESFQLSVALWFKTSLAGATQGISAVLNDGVHVYRRNALSRLVNILLCPARHRFGEYVEDNVLIMIGLSKEAEHMQSGGDLGPVHHVYKVVEANVDLKVGLGGEPCTESVIQLEEGSTRSPEFLSTSLSNPTILYSRATVASCEDSGKSLGQRKEQR